MGEENESNRPRITFTNPEDFSRERKLDIMYCLIILNQHITALSLRPREHVEELVNAVAAFKRQMKVKVVFTKEILDEEKKIKDDINNYFLVKESNLPKHTIDMYKQGLRQLEEEKAIMMANELHDFYLQIMHRKGLAGDIYRTSEYK